MATAPTYVYCTATDVERLLSANGVLLRLDDDADGSTSADELLALTDVRYAATETVNAYLYDKYSPARLADDYLITRLATQLAAYELCCRRGNPPPEAIVALAEAAEERLQKIRDGHLKLRIPLRRNLAPVFSNTRPDLRYTWRVIRVEKGTSSQQDTTLKQNIDHREQHTPETP